MYCSKCGKEIEEDSAFCPYCGEPVGNNAAYSNNQQHANRNVQAGNPGYSYYSAPNKQSSNGNHRGVIIAVIVAAVVVLVGIFAVVTRSGQSSELSAEANEEQENSTEGNQEQKWEIESEKTYFLEDGELISYSNYKYNNTYTEYTVTRYRGDDVLDLFSVNFPNVAWDSEEYGAKLEDVSYDENGNLMSYYWNGRCYDFTCDESGYLVSIIITDRNGDVESRQEFTNDADGNVLSSIVYDSDGNVEIAEENTYNSNGKLLSKRGKDGQGNITYLRECTYDKNGETILSYTGYDAGGDLSGEYTYDDNGNLVAFKAVTGSTSSLREYTYDENDKEISNIVYDSYGYVSEQHELTYNEHGELAKDTELISGRTTEYTYLSYYAE